MRRVVGILGVLSACLVPVHQSNATDFGGRASEYRGLERNSGDWVTTQHRIDWSGAYGGVALGGAWGQSEFG